MAGAAEIAGGWFDKALTAYASVEVAKINAGFGGALQRQVVGSATLPDAEKTGVQTYDIKTAVGTQVRPLVGEPVASGIGGYSPLMILLGVAVVAGVTYLLVS